MPRTLPPRTSVALVALALVASACGLATSEARTVDREPSESASTVVVQPLPSPTPTPRQDAAPGEALTVYGMGEQTKLEVRLIELFNPAAPADDFQKPADGRKYIAGRMEIRNVGVTAYEDAPGNGMVLVTARQERYGTEQYGETYAATFDCQPFDGSATTIEPGDSRRGCIAFEVPAEAQPTSLLFTADSGFGPQTAGWKVG